MATKTIQIDNDRVLFFSGCLYSLKTPAEKEAASKKLIKDFGATPVELFMATTDIENILTDIATPKKPTVRGYKKRQPKPSVESTLSVLVDNDGTEDDLSLAGDE